MNKRDLVGRTIADVHQTRFWNPQVGKMETSLDALVLDNGKVLHVMASETDVEPYVRAWVQ